MRVLVHTQFHVHKLCIMNIVMLWCCVMCVHISSADINIMCVVDVVSADSKSQSATTPTATPITDTTSQKPGEYKALYC